MSWADACSSLTSHHTAAYRHCCPALAGSAVTRRHVRRHTDSCRDSHDTDARVLRRREEGGGKGDLVAIPAWLIDCRHSNREVHLRQASQHRLRHLHAQTSSSGPPGASTLLPRTDRLQSHPRRQGEPANLTQDACRMRRGVLVSPLAAVPQAATIELVPARGEASRAGSMSGAAAGHPLPSCVASEC